MKTIYISVLDPSGHRRSLKLNRFPFKLGTQLQDKNGLRDPGLFEEALLIESKGDPETMVIRVLQEGLKAEVGDLKLQAFQIPMNLPIKIAETELVFSEKEPKSIPIEFPSGERPWYTESHAGLNLLRTLKRASQTRLSIYLSGETGTGKEVLAKLAHVWSDRASGPFIPINCGALPLSLVESELFGHVKGAFTGATRDRPGAFLQAHGGTLFLDEVGDLPTEVQVKILRFLENGEIRPVGSDRSFRADARILCATHKPLTKLVQEGKFRQDLYFRLATIPIEIPNLRSRPDDIQALAVVFAQEHGKLLSGDAILRLQANSWAGNVRELRNAVERAAGLTGPEEKVIYAKEFDFLLQQNLTDAGQTLMSSNEIILPGVCSLKEMERVLILRALRIVKGNRTEAAKLLGIARSTLFEMIKRHKIVGPKSTDYWLERIS